MADLGEIEAIKRLKYKYFRTLDLKKWDEMAECFTEDAKTSYSAGKYSFEGRDTIMGFLKQGLGTDRISMHQGHHPEIELTSDTTATGRWALQDYVIDLKRNTSLFGAAFYEDEYVKVNGEWKEPENIEELNTVDTEGWPFISRDGRELWFNRWYMGYPAIFRSIKTDAGWGEAALIISQFAAEPSLDDAGNLYFTHHFIEDGKMLDADIYVAYRK